MLFVTSPKSAERRASNVLKLKGIGGLGRRLNVYDIVFWEPLRRGHTNVFTKLRPSERLYVGKG